jgi:hypothetical protein
MSATASAAGVIATSVGCVWMAIGY